MLNKLLRKTFFSIDNIYNWILLKYRRVTVGKNVQINGKIFCVANSKDGITIGNNVTINSSLRANPIGGDTRTILFARGDAKICIGDECGISNATLFASQAITLGKGVFIGGGCKIYDSDFHWLNYEKRKNEAGGVTAPVVIKDGAFIGAHSIILKGVTIGEHAVVGAGSVVTKDIPANEIWGGNPVRFLRKEDLL